MIKKIKNIKNVGNIKNFQGTRDAVSFKRNTFIFGENTQGKSTLTAILKSLGTNNNDYIIGRKTFGGYDQNVVIEIDSDYIFNTSWNKNCKMKIFDSDYILENIYSDDVITEDKQKKITGIILGSEGKRLEEEWLEAIRAINISANRKREISRSYSSTFGNTSTDFQGFLKSTKGADLLEKIERTKEDIKSFSNQKEINSILQKIIDEIERFSLNRNELEKTLELNQEIIENHFANHLKTKDSATSFVSAGLAIMKDKVCPFCSQDIVGSATQLIEAYNVLIGENYRSIKKSVENAIYFLNNWDFERNVLTYVQKLSNLGLRLTIDLHIDRISDHKKEFIKELSNKNIDLTYCIRFDSFEKIVENLREMNKYINEHQEKYSSGAHGKDLKILNSRLSNLELQKKRCEKPWEELCDEYLDLGKQYKKFLKPKEENAFKDKNDYANSVLSSYQSTINDILKKLGASFTLTGFSIPQNRKEDMKLFALRFSDFEEEIPLINSMSSYNLKNTLSDSDKRLLAFAFFVVDIKNTANLSDYIIVLDDPMSSLDFNRKRHTIIVLRDELYNSNNHKPQQLIVLTHEPVFFTLLKDHFKNNRKFLRIEYVVKDSTSKIIPCDVDEEFLKGEHYKRLDYYKKCSNGDMDNIDLSNLRIVLEEIIKMKFYLEIDKPIIDSGGIISWYKGKNNNSINTRIDDLPVHLPHHTQSNRVLERRYKESEKKRIVSEFLNLITEI